MEEGSHVLISQLLFLVSDLWHLIRVLLYQRLECTFFVDVLVHRLLVHAYSVSHRDLPSVLREQTHGEGRGDHHIGSLGHLFCLNLRRLGKVIDSGGSEVGLLLGLNLIFVWARLLFLGRRKLDSVLKLLLVRRPYIFDVLPVLVRVRQWRPQASW